MANVELAEALVATLPSGIDGLFNPWRDRCPFDTPENSPEAKLERLAHHLDCDPLVIGVGEAAGYQGMRHSAVAFTSERLLLEGAIPRIPHIPGRLTYRALPFSEPSATVVWGNLYRLQIAERTVLWNAVALHPHEVVDYNTNRTPTRDEVELGKPALQLLTEAFPNAKIVAIGRTAERLLKQMGIAAVGAVQHPAYGGATKFAAGLQRLLAS